MRLSTRSFWEPENFAINLLLKPHRKFKNNTLCNSSLRKWSNKKSQRFAKTIAVVGARVFTCWKVNFLVKQWTGLGASLAKNGSIFSALVSHRLNLLKSAILADGSAPNNVKRMLWSKISYTSRQKIDSENIKKNGPDVNSQII